MKIHYFGIGWMIMPIITVWTETITNYTKWSLVAGLIIITIGCIKSELENK